MRSTQQRLFFILFLLVLIGGGFTLLATALRQNLDGYATPSDLLNRELEVGQVVSVGGLVVVGSLQAINDPLGSEFVISDGLAQIRVIRAGTLPDLFAEDELTEVQGPILSLNPLTLSATKVLAKHDQYYVPVDAQQALDGVREAQQAQDGQSGQSGQYGQ